MNYPSVGQYTETIKLAAKTPEDYFEKLSTLRPVIDSNGEPVMSSGNYAVVFKMYNPKNNKYYALKCFHREQEGRMQNYKKISEELNKKLSWFSYGTQNVSTKYLLNVQYYENELFVDIGESNSVFPVLLMDWVDGMTLDKCILQNLDNAKLLHTLTYRFSRMAKWLLSQDFAHGDLKPDNIIVTQDFQIVLVDYDGMYVPSMKGEKAHELGSPNFRHPNRTENDFNKSIDNFPIISIMLSLKAISLDSHLFSEFVTGDKLLFDERDYLTINNSKIIPLMNCFLNNREFAVLLGAFYIMLHSNVFPNSLSLIIDIRESMDIDYKDYSESESKEKILYFYDSVRINPYKIVYLIPDLFSREIRKYWIPNTLWRKYNVNSIWWNNDTNNSLYRWAVDYDAIQYSVLGEFSKKSRPDMIKMLNCHNNQYISDYTYEILLDMGLVNCFVENIDKLIEVISQNNIYTYNIKEITKNKNQTSNDDLPF